jgi:ATP-binding cassette subfamily B multidrug efflux pump
MLQVFKYLRKKEWLFMAVSLVFIVITVWLDLKLPGYMSEVTILVQSEGSNMRAILLHGVYMLLCAVGSMIASMIVSYYAARVAAGLSMRLRRNLFAKTMSFSMEEINKFSIASLITRTTNDITQVQFLIAMGLQALVRAPIMAVWAVVKISGKNVEWTAATGVAVLALVLMLSVIILLALPKFKIIQTLTDNLNRVTRENLTGIRVVRAYNAESYQGNKFDKANTDLTNTNLFANRMLAIMFPGMGFIMSGMTLSIYWIGAHLIQTAQQTDRLILFSDMVVFSAYAMQVIMSFMMLSMIFVMLPRASVAAKRIMQVLNTEARIIGGDQTDGRAEAAGQIEFKQVSFKYPDASDYVLHNISFTANKGETIAFIGATGSGKTTLVNLITRFYDAVEGEVLVGGVNVKDYTKEALHGKIGYVPQRAVLFSGTVSSNVAYGEGGRSITGSSESAVVKAVATAQGTEFVEKMEGGYDAAVSQDGTNLSGGQKQRVSIARAVYKQPEVYIFDDSFSALDYRTDQSLRAALKQETTGATSLIVAQRIGTIRDADKIIVLEDGRIVGQGTHDELMIACSTYQEIAYSQLSKEELAHEQA